MIPSALKGQWLLVSVGGGACDKACEDHLYQQRQLREILGKDKDRLDRVWLVTDEAPVRESLTSAMSQAWVRVRPRRLFVGGCSPSLATPCPSTFIWLTLGVIG